MYVDLSKMYSGFCDRLRQLTFCIAYEKLQNRKIKIIEVYEKKNQESPYYISELIEIKNCKIKNVKKKKTKVIKMDPFNSELSIKNCYKYNYKKLDNIKLLKEWKKAYKIIQPKKKIRLKLNKILKNKKYVSIHIRLTDKLVNFKNHFLEIPSKDVIYPKQFEEFSSSIETLIPKKFKYIYLSSDENIYRKKIKKKLINKFKFIERNIKYKKGKLRQTSGEDFIIDLFAMSKSSLIISSTGGNVPYASNLISGLKQNYIKWINYKFKYRFFYGIRELIFNIRNILNIINSKFFVNSI